MVLEEEEENQQDRQGGSRDIESVCLVDACACIVWLL
jgi:hypothetical protein